MDFRPYTRAQADLLIDHIDGPRQERVAEHRTRDPLIAADLLAKCNQRGMIVQRHVQTRWTILTDDGRMVLAHILSRYVERLVAAGCLEPDAVPVTIFPEAVPTAQQIRRGLPLFSPAVLRTASPERETT